MPDLTPEVQKVIVEALSTGAGYHTAARLVGVPESVLFGWLVQGKTDQHAGLESPERSLWDSCQQSIAGFEIRVLRRMAEAAEDDDRAWQAYARLLERRDDQLRIEEPKQENIGPAVIASPEARELANRLLLTVAADGGDESARQALSMREGRSEGEETQGG